MPNSVNAPESLFDAIWVPRQIVIDDDVRRLQVDALASGIGGDEYANVFVLSESVLDVIALVAPRGAVYLDDGIGRPEKIFELFGEVLERIAMLGEDDEFWRSFARSKDVARVIIALQKRTELLPFAIAPRNI